MSNLVEHTRRDVSASKIPPDYQWPGEQALASTTEWHYWLSEQPDCGATQLYMVIADGRGEQHIAAERCYLHWGMRIVDALRATQQEESVHHGIA